MFPLIPLVNTTPNLQSLDFCQQQCTSILETHNVYNNFLRGFTPNTFPREDEVDINVLYGEITELFADIDTVSSLIILNSLDTSYTLFSNHPGNSPLCPAHGLIAALFELSVTARNPVAELPAALFAEFIDISNEHHKKMLKDLLLKINEIREPTDIYEKVFS